MITGIKKTHKTTEIYFDEADKLDYGHHIQHQPQKQAPCILARIPRAVQNSE